MNSKKIIFWSTIFLFLSALNTGDNLHYLIISMLVSFWIFSFIVSKYLYVGLEINRVIPGFANRNKEFTVKITILNKTKFPKFFLKVKDVSDFSDFEILIMYLPPYEYKTFNYVVNPSYRGIKKFHKVEVTDFLPVSMLSKSSSIDLKDEIKIYPMDENININFKNVPFFHKSKTQSKVVDYSSSSEFNSLEKYQQNVPFNKIYWKRVLPNQDLLYKNYQDYKNSNYTIYYFKDIDAEIDEKIFDLIYSIYIKLTRLGFRVTIFNYEHSSIFENRNDIDDFFLISEFSKNHSNIIKNTIPVLIFNELSNSEDEIFEKFRKFDYVSMITLNSDINYKKKNFTKNFIDMEMSSHKVTI